jgi:hypothetical protein
MFKRKDWLIIAVALLLALGLFVLTRSGIRLNVPGGDDPMRVLTEVVQPTVSGAPPEATQGEAMAYLVLTLGDTRYKPLPLYKEMTYRLRQPDGKENVFHVTRDSVFMESASCDNQNCIHQGTVTLDNREARVLGNMIICLPNQVVLELITPKEAEEQAK